MFLNGEQGLRKMLDNAFVTKVSNEKSEVNIYYNMITVYDNKDNNWEVLFYADDEQQQGPTLLDSEYLDKVKGLKDELNMLAPAVNLALLLVLKIVRNENLRMHNDYREVYDLMKYVASKLSGVQMKYLDHFRILDQELTGGEHVAYGKAANSRGQMARLALAAKRLSEIGARLKPLNTDGL